MQEVSIAMNGYTLTEIHAVCYKQQPGITSTTEFFVVLGDIKISTLKKNTEFPPTTSWIIDGQDIEWGTSKGSKTLSLKISWKPEDEKGPLFPKYNIYVEKLPKQLIRTLRGALESVREYIGVAHIEAFYVSQLVIPSGTSSLKFIIQVCNVDGASQNLDDAPFFQLNVQS